MKTLKSILFFLFVTLFFACEKDAEPIVPSSTINLTYHFGTVGEVTIDEVRFLDENWEVQVVENPPLDWEYKGKVEPGFFGSVVVKGHLGEGITGNNDRGQIYSFIKGINEANRTWKSTHVEGMPGEFHIIHDYVLERQGTP